MGLLKRFVGVKVTSYHFLRKKIERIKKILSPPGIDRDPSALGYHLSYGAKLII